MAGGHDRAAPPTPLAEDAIAPALSILHACQQALGYVDEDAIRRAAAASGVSPTELYGAVLAYPRFRLAPGGPLRAVCAGPVCRMAGAANALRSLGGAEETHCLGLCDQPVAALTDDGPRVVRTGAFEAAAAPAPAFDAGRTAFFGEDDPWDAARTALSLPPEQIIDLVTESGLRGRGGAGFPAGRKWAAVRSAPGEDKVVVCNADESEPGTFKDRALVELQPDRVLAGLAIAAHAVGARLAVVYIRYEYGPQYERLVSAIARLRAQNAIHRELDIVVRVGAGAYVCGEETALLNSLEGRRPTPRDRPPYPFTSGLFGRPTLVQNVETLAAIPAIVAHGPSWFHDAGQPKLYCVSGDVPSPGVYELPMSVTARECLERAGADPRDLKAFTLGGLSGGLLSASMLDVRLDFEDPARYGASLGSGAIIALDASRCAVRFALDALRFFAAESCGKCFPCRIGTARLRERVEALSHFQPIDPREIHDAIGVLAFGSACGLGPSAALVARHLATHFSDEMEAHGRGRCPAGECSREARHG
jgi:NADH-quinone oxidoreductase subunit F